MELLHSPAADRNKKAICEIISDYIQDNEKILEIASGTGQHAEYICQQFPNITIQPTDIEPVRIDSINQRAAIAGLDNMLKAMKLDVLSDWPNAKFDHIFCSNMIHIAPKETIAGLFGGAQKVLNENSLIFLYGPFFEKDVTPVSSNTAFNNDLIDRNSEWGIRSRRCCSHSFIIWF